jgi:hypothetical protein
LLVALQVGLKLRVKVIRQQKPVDVEVVTGNLADARVFDGKKEGRTSPKDP